MERRAMIEIFYELVTELFLFGIIFPIGAYFALNRLGVLN